MNFRLNSRRACLKTAICMFILIAACLVAPSNGLSHGGKKHTDEFTALQALQKATKLYDKLVVSGKLTENWETDLREVQISTRKKEGQKEYVVSFQRASGQPAKVYIFFSAEGKYTGSNFTGE